MGNREPRPKRGAIAAVECEYFAGQGLVQSQGHLACNAGSYPWSAKSLAFETEVGNFVEWIDRTQPRAELETIDDLRGLAQPDVLRSQIAMPVYDALCAHALRKQRASAFKKQTLRPVNARNHSARQVEPRIQQDLVIDSHISLPLAQVQRRRKKWASRRSIEPHEKASYAIYLHALDATGRDGAVEQPRVVQPFHYDKPIDDGPSSSDRKTACR